VIPYLDFINEEAQKIGAVNCIKIEEGKLTGYNTDHFGFSESLKPLLNNEVRSALVLGTGGSAQAVFFVLKRLGIPYKVVSHSGKGDYDYHDLTKEIIKCHQLIINTTPLGMFPSIEEYPILPYSDLNEKHILFDLIYNPELTSFLKQGLAQNAQIKNGLEMLHFQAIKSWDIWNSNQKNSELNPIK
jgi:shikimate dehydrogenase